MRTIFTIGFRFNRNRGIAQTWMKYGMLRAKFGTSSQIHKKNSLVAAHMLPLSFDFNDIKERMLKRGANMTLKDKFILVKDCKDLNHGSGNVIITNNGVMVFWGESNSSVECYKGLVQDSTGYKESESLDQFSETMDLSETSGETKVYDGGIILTNSDDRKYDEIAISLALMTAVKLNYLEYDIKKNLELRNKEVYQLRNVLKSQNLDKAAKTLFELETYAHDCRYRLNLQQDLLEYPDVLWDYDKQCDLFNRVQSAFEVSKRLDHLNHRISWTLETLNSYSEYVRHKHSSRLEKIIIAVISVEMVLGLIQTVRMKNTSSST